MSSHERARWRVGAAAAIAVAAVLAVAQQMHQQHSDHGPAGIFYTVVPAHPIDVVASRPTAGSITLSLLALQETPVALTCSPECGRHAATLKAGVPWEVELGGLQADSAYTYTVASSAVTIDSGAFHTARSAGSAFTFDVQADSHLDENTDPAVYANTLHNIAADHPDFLIDLGDTFMTDKYADFHEAAPQYLAQRYYFGLADGGIPSFLVLGNHDGEVGWRTPGGDSLTWSRNMRTKYFPSVRPNAFYTAGPATSNYYAWTWGDALFVVLDPFTCSTEKPRTDADGWVRTLGRAQYDWLARTLAASHARYKLVFIHHLVGGLDKDSRGGVEASTYFEWGGENLDGTPGFKLHRPGWPMPIHQLLAANHVTAVFHGHDHLYVRQYRDGILYQEVPQPSSAREGQTASATDYGYTTGKLLGSPGHMRFHVTPAGITAEYVMSRLQGRNAEVADRYDIAPSSIASGK